MKLTDTAQAEIIAAMRAGAGYYRACAIACGVSGETARRWLRQGEAGDQPYASLAEAVERIRGTFTAKAEQTVHKAVENGDVSAARWLLTKWVPDEYGDVTRIQVEVERSVQEVLDSVEPHMSREAYSELLHALARVQGLASGEAGEHEQLPAH